ncbi:MAG TPA: MBL fold metallo-hydrolase [Phycisphaerales bacterium]|nr:MBL fold metallo-hydrolase [Phycisphaerales bacterium]
MDRPLRLNIDRPPGARAAPRLRVLASGSAGNCTVLRAGGHTVLIDAGLSPRRTAELLAECGLTPEDVDAILLTHLDSDHFHSGWVRALPERVRVFVHEAHEREAFVRGLSGRRRSLFQGFVAVGEGLCARATLTHHDELGTAAFRLSFGCGAELGFATDLGRTTDRLVEHLRGVDVLAVESNYCPRMQAGSDRPWFLKRRVMGGRGHLSNEECLRLIGDVGPRSHVVLLHLSRQCNDPTLVARLHAQKPYRVTITSQHAPTEWIEVRATSGAPPCAAPPARPLIATTLFDHLLPARGRDSRTGGAEAEAAG